MLIDSKTVVERLREVLDASDVRTEEAVLAEYSRDSAPFCEVGSPSVVVFPQNVAQVQHVMRVAGELGIGVVPQGARTGLAGAATAVDDGIVLNLQQMDAILDVDANNRLIRCQPGATTQAVAAAAAESGLAYPPDPVSFRDCTVGGNIATGAGGVCCVKYGVTADYVRGLSVVLADGRLVRVGSDTVKNVAGYNLTQLFVGAEGTLGVVVEATLALRPVRSDALALLAQFPSASAAGDAVAAIVAAGHTPSALELMDSTATQAVAALGHPDLVEAEATCLIVESDAPTQEDDVAEFGRLCEAAGANHVAVGDDGEAAARLLEARRMVPAALHDKAVSISPRAVSFIEDVAVPRTALAELIEEIEEISRRRDTWIATLGHAGDGNLHPIVVFDPDDEAQLQRAHAAYDDIMAAGLRLGGTISGEHGVGTLKKDWLTRQIDPVELALMQEIKKVFDPQGILNPGKVL
ncbi:FAD-binding oxidoreductase [Haloglycomyces albus]|uniref:FAD-binding oxidoreductase n=1 Tax=Haloglycomyces albus TaxID=526067 RepID=UPI0004A21D55|nr:FAD-linked oxidase C-terminal domain-containing protein [Haloglycomyces albus]